MSLDGPCPPPLDRFEPTFDGLAMLGSAAEDLSRPIKRHRLGLDIPQALPLERPIQDEETGEEDQLDASDDDCLVEDVRRMDRSDMSKSPSRANVRLAAERTGPRKGGRLGRLRAMLDQLPLEILAEILSHLPSASLLRLSRVAKLFRNLLLSRSASRTIWQSAFRVDGIAHLHAADLSEPEYAAMIWDKECEQCGRKKVHHIHYRLRKRLCDPCLKEWIRRPEDITRLGILLHPDTFKCTPHTLMPPWRGDYLRGEYYLEMELRRMSDKLTKLEELDKVDPLSPLEPKRPQTPSTPLSPLAETPFPSNDVDDEPVPPPAEPVQQTRVGNFVKAWVGVEASEGVKGEEGLMDKAMADAETLTQWQAKLEDARRAQRTGDKSVRAEAIAHRLRDAGCDELDIAPTLGPFSKVLKEVEQPYPLTDRVWRKIKEPVLAEVERFKQVRLNPQLEPKQDSILLNVEPVVLQQTGMYGNVLLPGRSGAVRHHLLQGQPLVAGRVGGQQGYFVQVQPTAGARIAFAQQQQQQAAQPRLADPAHALSAALAAGGVGSSAQAGQYYHQLQLHQAALAARAAQARAQQQLLFQQQQHRAEASGPGPAHHPMFGRQNQPFSAPPPSHASPAYAGAASYAELLALAQQQQQQHQARVQAASRSSSPHAQQEQMRSGQIEPNARQISRVPRQLAPQQQPQSQHFAGAGAGPRQGRPLFSLAQPLYPAQAAFSAERQQQREQQQQQQQQQVRTSSEHRQPALVAVGVGGQVQGQGQGLGAWGARELARLAVAEEMRRPASAPPGVE